MTSTIEELDQVVQEFYANNDDSKGVVVTGWILSVSLNNYPDNDDVEQGNYTFLSPNMDGHRALGLATLTQHKVLKAL